MSRILGLLLLTLTLSSALPDYARASTSQSAVLFLRIAAGARAAGMGESFVAVADDATATHWNPAGLGKYPLYSEWYENFLPQGVTLSQIALLRNEVPDNNYSRYDIWGISSSDLYHWDGLVWRNWESINRDALRGSITKIASEPEAQKELFHKVAEFNYKVGYRELADFRQKTIELVPEQYQLKKNFDVNWNRVLEGWENLRLEPANMNQILAMTKSGLADGRLTIHETEQIYFSLEKAINEQGSSEVKIPYQVFLPDSLTALSSDEENTLWIGTRAGLYSYTGSGNWKKFGKEEGMELSSINCLASGPNGILWAGGPEGICRNAGGRFTTVYEYEVQMLGEPKLITLKNERMVWVATPGSLVYFDGTNWRTNFTYTAKIGDTPEKVVQQYLGRSDDLKVSAAAEQLRQLNSISGDQLEPNSSLLIPYQLAIDGQITVLTLDKADRLWLGSSTGVKRFDGKSWVQFGYSLYTVSLPGETTESIAAKFLQTSSADRASALADRIRGYNYLDTTQLQVGQKLYIYHNIAGSRILAIEPTGRDEVFVGTEFGTIRYSAGVWSRYYHAGLEKDKSSQILAREGEMWFCATNRVVIYAHAKKEFTFMFAKWLPELASDLYYAYASYVQHLEEWGTLGANITFLNLGTSQRTDEIGQSLGEFTSYDAALTLSYGTKFSDNTSLGLSAKFIYSNLASVGAGRERGSGTGTSFALDAGLLYTPYQRLTIGAAITNLGPDITYIDADQSDPLPRNLAIGFAYRLWNSPYNRLTLIGEVNKELVGVKDGLGTEFEEAIWNGGLEYWYGSFFAGRMGYIYDKVGSVQTLTFGATLQYTNYHFDLAYIPARKDLALSNTLRLSITARF
ncbi:MAG: PorV/PorQ family protein [candidate division Zixibacteria bacterium]|nr:PorV/PorQ family protein [candidate division Zixibacteria bacterium]